MNVIAISGSTRTKSYNTAFLRAIAKKSVGILDVDVYDQLSEIPVFNPDINENERPDSVTQLRARIAQSDGVIISIPEYAHGVPGAAKNLLDWLVDAPELVLKPVAVVSVSTSGLGGIRATGPLMLTLSAMNWNVVVEASMNIPYARQRFNNNLEVNDDITLKRIESCVAALVRAIEISR